MQVSVKSIVCDYGVYIDDELQLILNSKSNAELIADIIKKDVLCGHDLNYTYTPEDAKQFFDSKNEGNKSGNVTINGVEYEVKNGYAVDTSTMYSAKLSRDTNKVVCGFRAYNENCTEFCGLLSTDRTVVYSVIEESLQELHNKGADCDACEHSFIIPYTQIQSCKLVECEFKEAIDEES